MAAAPQTRSFETGHTEMIHDAKMDYYGKRLATASSDRTIKIFDVTGESQTEIARLEGHTGPVWQVAWAHPKIRGNILASCGYDGRIILWQEENQQWRWTVLLQPQPGFAGSVNALCWAPQAFGLVLAAAGSNGLIYMFELDKDGRFVRSVFEAHKSGANSVSWGPDSKTGALVDSSGASQSVTPTTTRRLVTGGCDNRVKVWRLNGNVWEEEPFQNSDNLHKGWVRDVAWAPSLGLPSNVIASASEDKSVIMWTENSKGGYWKKKQVLQFKHKVWGVSWSVMGNILAVSQGDNEVSLWKQAIDGQWKQLSSVKETKDKTAEIKKSR